MPQWLKIIVSSSQAHLQAVTASILSNSGGGQFVYAGPNGELQITDLVQIVNGELIITGSLSGSGGTGADLTALNAFTASYFVESASFSSSIASLETWSSSLELITPNDTGSFMTTASVSSNTITFVKADGSTFPILINTGSGGIDTGSFVLTSSFNLFTSSYQSDSSSFSSSISNLETWSSSLVIPGAIDTSSFITDAQTGSFATTQSNIFYGSQDIRLSVTASNILISSSGTNQLEIIGSGSSDPLMKVTGDTGELFTISDSLSGSLLAVVSSSGDSIFEIFSDQTIHMGSTALPVRFTSKLMSVDAGNTDIYSIDTGSYDSTFFEYSIKSGSNIRSGNIMSSWLSSEITYTETTTTDIGDTSNFTMSMYLSQSLAILSGSTTSDSWTVKTLIKNI